MMQPEETAEKSETVGIEESASSETVGVRAGETGAPTRPLSQFILAKQFDTITAGPRSSLFTSVQRPPEKRSSSRPASPRGFMRPCRVEYPLYDGDSDEDASLSAVPNEPEQLVPETPEPVSIELTPSSFEAVFPEPSPAACEMKPKEIVPEPAPGPFIRVTAADSEVNLPLDSDRGRRERFPIFERYLAVSRSRAQTSTER